MLTNTDTDYILCMLLMHRLIVMTVNLYAINEAVFMFAWQHCTCLLVCLSFCQQPSPKLLRMRFHFGF